MTLSEWKRGVSKVYNIYQTILKPSFLPTSGFILDLCVFSLQPIQGLELKNLKHPWIQKRSTPQNWRPPAPFRRSPVSAAWKKPQDTAWTSWNPAEIRRSPFQPLQIGSLSYYLQGFIHARWLFFSDFWTINSMTSTPKSWNKNTHKSLFIELDVSNQLHFMYFLHCPGIISNIQLYVFIYCTSVSITRNPSKPFTPKKGGSDPLIWDEEFRGHTLEIWWRKSSLEPKKQQHTHWNFTSGFFWIFTSLSWPLYQIRIFTAEQSLSNQSRVADVLAAGLPFFPFLLDGAMQKYRG